MCLMCVRPIKPADPTTAFSISQMLYGQNKDPYNPRCLLAIARHDARNTMQDGHGGTDYPIKDVKPQNPPK